MTTGSSFTRVKALIVKEFYQIIRDPSTLLISVILPLILLFIYGYGVSLDMNHLRIGLVLQDNTPDAHSFAESLKNSRYFEVQVVREFEDISDQIIAGTIRGIVVVPFYFSQYLNRTDDVAPIQ